MEEHLCTSCGASLPPTGTYCLACDTPVADTSRGLSVAPSTVIQVGRPWIAIAIGVATLTVLTLIVVGIGSILSGRQNGAADVAARNALSLILRAESGYPSACSYIAPRVAGDPTTERQACLAVAGDDRGVRARDVKVAATNRHGKHGTVELQGTLVDRSGRRPFATTLPVVKVGHSWRVAWNGTSIARG